MILSALFLPRTQDAKLPLNAFLAFWFAILVWSIYFIFQNGKLYVQWPRLVPLPFAPDVGVGGGMQRSRRDSLEKGEREHKRDVTIAAGSGLAEVWGALFGRWVPGPAGGDDVDLVGIGKEGRAHAE